MMQIRDGDVKKDVVSGRTAWTAIVSMLILLGGLLAVGAALAFVKSGEPLILAGLAASIIAALVGVFFAAAVPYQVSYSAQMVAMRFVVRTDEVPWECVRSYRPVAVNVSLTPGEAGIWTVVRYRLRPLRRGRIALVHARGRGPGFGSVGDYETVFDVFVPAKRVRGVR